MFNAYHAAVLSRAEKIRPLTHYLKAMRPKTAPQAPDLISRFEAMAEQGLNVRITKRDV